jgi:hypothetical protein
MACATRITFGHSIQCRKWGPSNACTVPAPNYTAHFALNGHPSFWSPNRACGRPDQVAESAESRSERNILSIYSFAGI